MVKTIGIVTLAAVAITFHSSDALAHDQDQCTPSHSGYFNVSYNDLSGGTGSRHFNLVVLENPQLVQLRILRNRNRSRKLRNYFAYNTGRTLIPNDPYKFIWKVDTGNVSRTRTAGHLTGYLYSGASISGCYRLISDN